MAKKAELQKQQETSLSPELVKQIEDLERVSEEYSLVRAEDVGSFKAAITLAKGIQKLNAMITKEIMQDIMALQGTALGFKTDQDTNGGYAMDTVKRVFIEATLRGFRPVGNEFNIISGGFYGTKNGFTRKVRELPDLANLKESYEIQLWQPPTSKGNRGKSKVKVSATFLLKGKKDAFEAAFPILVNFRMTPEAVIGKASRKFKAALFAYITGSEHIPEGEVGDVELEKAAVTASQAPDEADVDLGAIEPSEEPVQPHGETLKPSQVKENPDGSVADDSISDTQNSTKNQGGSRSLVD